MSKKLAKQRIKNCLEASKRTIDPQWRAYWINTAKKLAEKYRVNVVDKNA